TRNRHLIVGVVRKAYPEVIRLYKLITTPLLFEFRITNAPQQSAIRITGHYIRIHAIRELIPIEQLAAVVSFTIQTVCLATDKIAHARCRHKVAFIGGIDKDLPRQHLSTLHRDADDSITVFRNPTISVESFPEDNLDAGFRDHILEYF